MTLSRVLAALTGREPESSPRPASTPGSSPDVAATLLKSERLQLVSATGGEPTLGAARDVRERIAEVLPGVIFDDDGRGAFTRTGYSVAFDAGVEEQVRAVGVQITGGPAAVPPLARLISKTGWRLIPAEGP